MDTLYFSDKEYLVPDRVERLASRLNAQQYTVKILESKNFQEGKIPEYILLAAILDSKYKKNQNNWINLLKSEIFGNGLISYDVATKLIEIKLLVDWSIIDKQYQKGIIKEDCLKQLFEIVEKDDDEDYSNVEIITNSVLTILTSEEYEKGKISDDTVKLLLSQNEKLEYIQSEIIISLFNKENITGNIIDDRLIQSILESTDNLINTIIYYIIIEKTIEKEQKEEYVLAVLNLNNKENLSNIYHSYVENKKVNSINEFAKNFVLYTLSLLQTDLDINYTRKKQK